MPTAPPVLARIGAYVERRRDRRALCRDLASYDTPAAVDDLLVAVDRHEGPDARLIRSILSDHQVRRERIRAGVPITR